MTRISILTDAEMTEEQKSVIAESKAAGKPHGGPFWAYIRNPRLMRLVQDTAECIGESTLSPREQQIATLAVARFWGAKYPWAVQVRNALKIGMNEAEVDAINTRKPVPTGDAREKLAQQVADQLLAEHGLSDATYKAAEAAFSTDELVALVARISSFSMTCCTVNAFDVTPPDDAPARLAE
ncbi:MAG: hypothetical protein GEU92_14120 [Alphaproteobacteria bacterium]|nr:hypothetical protein [Alphaproteobacteria bacterium]